VAYTEARKVEEADEGIVKLVCEIQELMGISFPEIFATISVALVSLAQRWLVHGELNCSNKPSCQRYYTAQNLRDLQVRALDLASVHGSRFDFIMAFLTAYGTIDTAKAPGQAHGAE
jgi:hypothetical protein